MLGTLIARVVELEAILPFVQASFTRLRKSLCITKAFPYACHPRRGSKLLTFLSLTVRLPYKPFVWFRVSPQEEEGEGDEEAGNLRLAAAHHEEEEEFDFGEIAVHQVRLFK